jgi:diguanylate cyclase (GGDEF)-like protein
MIWPASGFAAVMLLWAGTRARRGVVLVSIVVGTGLNAAWRHGFIPNELGYLVGNLVEPLVMLPFLVRGTSVGRRLDRPASVAWLLSGAFIATAGAAAVVAVFAVWGPGGSGEAALWLPTWIAFGLGDVTGILLVTPLLLQATPLSKLWAEGSGLQQSVLWTALVLSAFSARLAPAWIVACMLSLVLMALVLDSSAASLGVLIFGATVLWQWEIGRWPIDEPNAIDARFVLIGAAVVVQSIALSTSQRRAALAGEKSATGAAQRARAEVSRVMDAVPLGIAVYSVERRASASPVFRLSFMNSHGLGQAGILASEIVGKELGDFYPELGDSEITDRYVSAWATGQTQEFLLDNTSSTSGWQGHYQVHVVPLGDDKLVATWHDVSAIEQARVQAEEDWNLLRRALDSGLDAFFVVQQHDDQWQVAFVNHSGAVRAGSRMPELVGQPLDKALPYQARGPVTDLINSARERFQPQQALVDLRTSGTAWSGEFDVLVTPASASRVVVAFRDVTEMQMARRALETEHSRAVAAAQHDSLTGLANRSLLTERLLQAQLTARDKGTLVAIVFLDVDAFKTINDLYGHLIGDHVLTTIAARLRQSIRHGDTAARIGGDEFILVLNGITEDWTGAQFAHRLAGVLHLDVSTEEATLHVTVSAGYAIGDASVDPQILIRRADAAMYASKAERQGDLVAYQPGMSRPERTQQ